MLAIKKLVDELKKFPEDSFCFAYEGEVIGIIIIDKSKKNELGHITTSESADFKSETIFEDL